MRKLVETPRGKGRLVAATEVRRGWRVRVELSGGGVWTGSNHELSGAGDGETVKALWRELGGRGEAG
ncbi:MAG TPA: hypothetical protein VFS64_02255 [Solirubrobacterales bacterium]|nr:hypothetical protein [Solirubrobacterales bacterium]